MREAAVEPVSASVSTAVEDLARADWYALLAALFRAPPAAALLARIAAADPARGEPDTELGRAFAQFARACATADADTVRAEYDAVFVGVGRPEVFVNASYYLAGFLHERPLADLREHLAGIGLARSAQWSQTEDHAASLFEVMRFLIVEADPPAGGLPAQREFFERFVGPWFERLCDALEQAQGTGFYRHVGRLAGAFLTIERQAFDFDS